VHESGV